METTIPAASPSEGAHPIARRSLHDEVVTRVRDLIIEGALAPGTRVNETHLCQTLGVSRTPLREALKFLASEGLIELVAARGAVVKKFSAKDVRDMLDVLSVLEAFAARLACREARRIGFSKALFPPPWHPEHDLRRVCVVFESGGELLSIDCAAENRPIRAPAAGYPRARIHFHRSREPSDAADSSGPGHRVA